MEICYKETCRFCGKEKAIGEEEFIQHTEEPFNETSAKKYLKKFGWKYCAGGPFCKNCFKKMENGYVVISKFKEFMKTGFACDTPDLEHIMSKAEAKKFVSEEDGEDELVVREALGVILSWAWGEWKVDVVGAHLANPDREIFIGKP
ncbi:hypothetical protein ACN9TB_10360 [Lactococcus lactis]